MHIVFFFEEEEEEKEEEEEEFKPNKINALKLNLVPKFYLLGF